jgi:hypothetical protein
MDKDKQMQFLFEEGGIADDGMNRDPISGNEVPPGSLAEEVRDDIPAQLSEGEYVVPADVVRYYGVKFFEDLRGQAKQGLGQMENDGRIGGEPVDMMNGEQLSPEEEAELQAMIGMAVGGFVTDQPTQATDPYMAQAQLYRAPAPVAVGNTGYADGGDVTDDQTQIEFNPSQYAPGFTFAQPAQSSRATPVILYGPDGKVMPVMFPSAEYDKLIAEGYTTQQGPASVTPEASPEVTGEGTGGGGGGGGYTTFSGQAPRDLSELSIEELQSNLRGLDTMGRIGGALAIAVNPMFGLAARAALSTNRNNIIQELIDRGVDMDDYREERGRDIFGGGISLYDGLQDQPGSRSGVDFGDTWLGDALGFDGKLGVQGPGFKESREGARRSFDSTAPATITPAAPATITPADPEREENDSFSFPERGRVTAAEARRGSESVISSAERNLASSEEVASMRSEADRIEAAVESRSRGASIGFKEGGFVSRRNKNKK